MKKDLKPDEIKRIVVLRTDRIGEVLLSTVVVEALKKNFPNARVGLVTSSYAKDVISGRNDLEEVIIFSTVNRRVPLWKAVIVASKLRDSKFDMAVVLNPHKVLHLGVFLAGIPYRVGFNRKWGFLLTHKTEDKRAEGRMHEVEYNLGLLNSIGIVERDIAPHIVVDSGSADYVEGLLKERNISPDKGIIVIHPGSSNPAKRWPIENFIETAKMLASLSGFNLIVVGDESEKDICARIALAAGSSTVHNLSGLLGLKELAALLKKTRLMITNDNGPMHIAAAAGAKVIAVFGRNIPGVSPTRWGPYGKGHIVFHKDPGCDPCYDKDCPYGFKCLRAITAGEIFDAAMEILK